MRKFAILFFLINSNIANSDSIQKWTDASGQIHYGDNSSSTNAKNKEQIVIHGSFDEASYKAAMIRNAALYKEIKKIEKQEKYRAKKAEKRLNDYFKYLENKSIRLERIRAKKQRLRDLERNRTSIKLKRSKPKKVTAKKRKSSKSNK